jgi:Flp pilus assembly protein CpaB
MSARYFPLILAVIFCCLPCACERSAPSKGEQGPAAPLDKETRALTIKGTVDATVAAFILPGSRVDLIGMEEDPKRKGVMAKIMAQDLPVLAADVMEPDKKDATVRSITVTLAVKREEVERIQRVFASDTPHVVLRRPDEEKPVPNTKKDDGGLSQMLPPGTRAVTIRCEEAVSVMPGARVDVLVSETVNGKNTSKIMFQDVRALAINRADPKDGKGLALVTLVLTPTQMEQILRIAASPERKITLVLHRPENKHSAVRW